MFEGAPALLGRTSQDLDAIAQEAVVSKLADSTKRSYGTGWKQWQVFLAGTSHSPFLEGKTRREKQEASSF